MESITKFSSLLKNFLDQIPYKVWHDFNRNEISGRIWGENEILRSSILKDGFDNRRLMDEVNNSSSNYRINFGSNDIGGTSMETITGADLAIIVKIMVNNRPIGKKLLLVQLKRASIEEKSKKVFYNNLHHCSGEKYFGRKIHQAERMLLFSNNSYYWFANNGRLYNDSDFFRNYVADNNLRHIQKNNFRANNESLPLHALSNPFFASIHDILIEKINQLDDDELLEYFYLLSRYEHKYFYYFTRKYGIGKLKEKIKLYIENIPFDGLHQLKLTLKEISKDSSGVIEKMALPVCSAETILGFSIDSKNLLNDIYSTSIPFTEFMLNNIVGFDFNSYDEEIIDAISKNDKKKLFRIIIERWGYEEEKIFGLNELDIVKHVMSLQISFSINQNQG